MYARLRGGMRKSEALSEEAATREGRPTLSGRPLDRYYHLMQILRV